MAKISDRVLEQIKARLSLGEVVSDYVNLTARGGRLWGLCPFHEEKTPSFSVVDEQGFYYCFSCKKGGSMFDFIMEMEKVSFAESVGMLARRANVEIEEESEGDRIGRDLRGRSGAQRRSPTRSTTSLSPRWGAEARAYLKRRGVAREMWGASTGYATRWLWLYQFLQKHHWRFAARRQRLFSRRTSATRSSSTA